MVGAGQASLVGEPRACRRRPRARRAGPARVGQLARRWASSSRHAERTDQRPGLPRRRRRPGRRHAPRRGRGVPRAHVPERRAGPRGRRGDAGCAVDGGFALSRRHGPLTARAVVVATGAYQRPEPAGRGAGPRTCPTRWPGRTRPRRDVRAAGPGVGSGQSGRQLAEELHDTVAGRASACGRAPWASRRLGGRDLRRVGERVRLPRTSRSSRCRARTRGSTPTSSATRATAAGATSPAGRSGPLGVTLTRAATSARSGRRAQFAGDHGATVARGDERRAALVERCHKPPTPGGSRSPTSASPEPSGPRTPRSSTTRVRRGLRHRLPPPPTSTGPTSRGVRRASASRAPRGRERRGFDGLPFDRLSNFPHAQVDAAPGRRRGRARSSADRRCARTRPTVRR